MSAPTPGTPAPGFTLRTQHGETVALSDLRGDAVLLVFYPFAFTGVCTAELRALQGAGTRLAEAAGGTVHTLAVSCDSMHSLRIFADQEGLDFPLLSDFWPHGNVSREYGVFDEDKGCAQRGTFVIDPAGIVRWTVHNGLPDARDTDDYVKALAGL
ncbi:Alkyl hydroperoxide reductase E [Streptomyces sp. RB5]|uniref:Alkyl hydroperoxide reductase E n=1 Tax=Streptomyces smaragdinus TaxID=2585196 RepID=A0A7K0CE27_9ACTN|nr:peroxiredoxin [Streptomyces smaragdinus]MQY11322.1 Alkyl hydroperoxide reductase E [Streptomyces smaragdinus]